VVPSDVGGESYEKKMKTVKNLKTGGNDTVIIALFAVESYIILASIMLN